jgi:hypothetical protein
MSEPSSITKIFSGKMFSGKVELFDGEEPTCTVTEPELAAIIANAWEEGFRKAKGWS